MSGIRRTTRKEPVYGEQGLRLLSMSRQMFTGTIASLSPVLWWDFSQTDTVTTSGTEITAITDKGSRGWTLTKSTTGPQYVTGINGLKCVDWGSTSHSNYLRNTSTTSTDIADVYVVLDASFGSTFPTFSGLLTSTAENFFITSQNTGNTGFSGGGGFDRAYINGSPTDSFSSVLPAINTACVLRVNRNSGTTSTGTGGIQLGMDRVNTGRGWYGLIGEVAIFSTVLSGTDSAAVVGELMTKWGIS